MALCCYDCDVSEEDEKLFFCSECQPRDRKIFCLECGAPNHRRLNHRVDPTKFKPADFVMNEAALDIAKHKGGKEFTLAVGYYLTEGTQQALSKVQKVVGSTGGAIGSAIGTSVAVSVLENGTKEIVKAGVKGVLYGSGIATAGIFVVEAIYLGHQFAKGKIDGKEFGRRLCKSVVRNGTSLGCAVAGAAIGALAGPVGAFIGAIIGGIIGSVGSDRLFEKFWPNEDQQMREKQIEAALKQFGIDKNRLKDRKHFNKEILSKKYKVFAKEFHPDRPTGNEAAFKELAVNYGILLALLDDDGGKNNQKHEDAVKKVLALPLDAEN